MKALKVKLEPLVPRVRLALLVPWAPWVLWVQEECQEKEGDLGHRVLLDNEEHMVCLENPGQWVLLGYLAPLAFQEILG